MCVEGVEAAWILKTQTTSSFGDHLQLDRSGQSSTLWGGDLTMDVVQAERVTGQDRRWFLLPYPTKEGRQAGRQAGRQVAHSVLLPPLSICSFPHSASCARRSMATLRPTTTASPPKSLFLSRTYLAVPPSLYLRRTSSYPAVRCVFSAGGGGGLADEFVSTRRSEGGHFSTLADLLLGIEPLDTQVVGKGVSAHARDSMKRTISAMLGLLPSDQFHVAVRLFNRPLHQLLLSSLITGYTLWNAEYRMSLIRNYDLSPHNTQQIKTSDDYQIIHGTQQNETPEESRAEDSNNYPEMGAHESLGEFSSAAERYIGNMESELQNLHKELDAQKCENLYLEHNREDSNDLLEYLRSLDPPMVYELSKPSSSEVEGIIYQLAQSIHHKFFNEAQSPDEADESGAHASRDHLAKLLFWCMLMGHHLRGLEYRLHLSWLI